MSAQLIPLALPRWQHFQRVEAREKGYKVTFVGLKGRTCALFFNGQIFCYCRVYKPEESQNG